MARACRLTVVLSLLACLAVPAAAATEASEPPCEVTTDNADVGKSLFAWNIGVDCGGGGGQGGGGNGPGDGGGSLGPTHFAYTLSYSETQPVCWRVAARVGRVNAEAGRFRTARAAGNAAMAAYAPTLAPDDGTLIGVGLPGGATRRDQVLPCVDPADEVTAAVITPLQRALLAWQSWSRPLTPAIHHEPTTYSVVGVPTIVSIDPYQPDYDLDDDPRTITWSHGAIEIRATASHRVHWDDPDAPEPSWLDTNGRRYEPGDEDGAPYPDPQPITHVYTVATDRTVTVDVRWTGEWRDTGGAWSDLPAAPIDLTDSADIEVDEIQAVVTQ